MDRLKKRRSRCSDKDSGPYQWLHHVDESHPSVKELESWLESLTIFTRSHELGRIDNLFEKASQGELWQSDDNATPIKPITSDPELFELRHKALSKTLRFYHGEPERYPQCLVALHRHIKSDGLSQQSEIEFAIDRYRGEIT